MSKDIASYSQTKAILDKYNLQAKKSFGQNFLIDNNITKNIVKNAQVTKETCVIEIGPGIGSLSQELARAAKKVVCVEIDERMKDVLEENLAEFNNVKVIFQDFLKLNLDKFLQEHFAGEQDVVLVANLPYYITTAILIKIFETDNQRIIKRICAMMQKEVGLRLSAQPGCKDYNSLSILTQYYTNVKIVMKVPKTVFIPAPNVDSVVVLFEMKQPEIKPKNESLFFEILRILFTQRRKTILNNLNLYFNNKEETFDVLKSANLNPQLRAENLTLKQIINLSDLIESRR